MNLAIQRLIILANEPIAPINPFLHGHFAEHLGELIYPGVCAAPESITPPHTNGIRHDVVAALKPLHISVLRWPGGCFADSYHWRDGIGPVDKRPMRVNAHWGMTQEPGWFGSHEFVAFCRALGAEPYFAANLGSAPPSETRDWIEYCNFDGNSALANERRTNGADRPFGIRFWGIGNENWGCGGSMSPEEYAGAYARYATFAFNYSHSDPTTRIACGPNGPDWAWTERFFDSMTKTHDRLGLVQGIGAHYYAGAAGTATEYTESQWLELLAKSAAIDGIITGHRAIMDRYDPERKIKLLMDEWGAWHPVEKGKPSQGCYQQNTIRDACVAALSLDTFHNHANKLFMANIAQIINVLQSVLLVDENRVVKTPTYHVFDLYQPHKGALALKTVFESETISEGETEGSKRTCRNCYPDQQFAGLRAVQGSASLGGANGKSLCVTMVNSHPSQRAEIEIDLRGTSFRGEIQVVVLAAEGDLHAHNTFETPERILPGAPQILQAHGSRTRLELPPASITRILAELA